MEYSWYRADWEYKKWTRILLDLESHHNKSDSYALSLFSVWSKSLGYCVANGQ